MKLAKAIALLGLLAMTAVLIYGFTAGDFLAEGSRLLEMPWGIVSLVDLYVGFILFSPTGLVGVAERLLRPFRKVVVEDAAMSARKAGTTELPDFLKHPPMGDGHVLVAALDGGGVRID